VLCLCAFPSFVLSRSLVLSSTWTPEVEDQGSRIKDQADIRSPTPNIISYSTVPDTYTRDSTATKASSTLTLGPFHSLPPTLGDGVTALTQVPLSVHYESKTPVVGLRTLKRSAEVSHWGGNLNIQDEMELVNNGPK
jgi:oligosaccharyltransferase complex subunit alpha (ribophorin I)